MTEDEKEKWQAAFTDPAGVSLHAFSDRNGLWRARVTCSDGSHLYTSEHHTPHGLFTWLAESMMLIRMFAPEPGPFIVVCPPDPAAVERIQKFVDSQGMSSSRPLVVEEDDGT